MTGVVDVCGRKGGRRLAPVVALLASALPASPALAQTAAITVDRAVVRWERSIVEEADCVEVTGSHIGLIANRKAYRVIAGALARPELAVARTR